MGFITAVNIVVGVLLLMFIGPKNDCIGIYRPQENKKEHAKPND
jgi:hypothetical protein